MKETKILYTLENELDADVVAGVGEIVKYFPQIYWWFVLYGIKISLIFAIIFGLCLRSILVAIIFFVGNLIVLMVYYKLNLRSLYEETIISYLKKGIIESKGVMEFYEDYFICKRGKAVLNIKYDDISKSIETDTSFYFKWGKIIGCIKKGKRSNEFYCFIRRKFANLEICLGDSKIIK